MSNFTPTHLQRWQQEYKGTDGTSVRRDAFQTGAGINISRDLFVEEHIPRQYSGEQKEPAFDQWVVPARATKPSNGGSEQRQHSYRKGVLDIAYLQCSASHG